MDVVCRGVSFTAMTVVTRLPTGFSATFLPIVGYLLVVGFLGRRDG